MPVVFKRRDVWKPGARTVGENRAISNKILLVLPFWNGDRTQMMLLARLIADLETSHSEIADVLFVARFDTQHDLATVEHVSRKFNVLTHTSLHREVGWPHGCNGLTTGVLDFLVSPRNRVLHYKAVLICEADCIPLARDWISRLCQQRDSVSGVKIAGALISAGGREHINGGCCFLSGDSDFLLWLHKCIQRGPSAGWDWALAGELQTKGWANIPTIWSHWRSGSKNIEAVRALMAAGVLLFHGVNDASGAESVRAVLL